MGSDTHVLPCFHPRVSVVRRPETRDQRPENIFQALHRGSFRFLCIFVLPFVVSILLSRPSLTTPFTPWTSHFINFTTYNISSPATLPSVCFICPPSHLASPFISFLSMGIYSVFNLKLFLIFNNNYFKQIIKLKWGLYSQSNKFGTFPKKESYRVSWQGSVGFALWKLWMWMWIWIFTCMSSTVNNSDRDVGPFFKLQRRLPSYLLTFISHRETQLLNWVSSIVNSSLW